MATHFYIVYPTGQNAGSTLYPKVPTGAHIISTPVGSAEDKGFLATTGFWSFLSIGPAKTYQGMTVFAGPFDSEAQALAFKPISGAPAFGAMLGAGLAGLDVGLTGNPAATGLVAPAANAGAAAGAALNPLGALFQRAIWIRVAEVALGIALLLVGLAKLTNVVPAAEKALGKVVVP